MKVEIKVAQTGLYNGQPWPPVGETIDLPDHVAVGMIANGQVEAVRGPSATKQEQVEEVAQAKDEAAGTAEVETRPAAVAEVEKRPATKATKSAKSAQKS